jgi:Na+/melibiose symporter-like transporter
VGNLDTATVGGLRASREAASLGLGVAVLLSAVVTIGLTWRFGRRQRETAPAPWNAVWRELAEVGRNPLFMPLLLSFVVVSLGRAMNSVLALPYYKYSLSLPEEAVQGSILGLFALCIILSVALWIPLSRRYGKRWPGFAGMLTLGLLTCVAYPFFPVGGLAGPMVAAVIGGVAVGAIILFESMVTDVAEADRARSGEDREGVYFGLWRLGQKVANAGGVFATGLLLEAIGFVEGATSQSAATARSLAWLFGPGVGVFFILGAFLFVRGARPAAGVEADGDGVLAGEGARA